MQVFCPECHEPTEYEGNPHRPFCSERCRLLDLGEWAQEKYAVPTEELPSAEELVEKAESGENPDEES